MFLHIIHKKILDGIHQKEGHLEMASMKNFYLWKIFVFLLGRSLITMRSMLKSFQVFFFTNWQVANEN